MNVLHPAFSLHGVVFPMGTGFISVLWIIFILWSLAWKGVALWFAARNHQKKWFIILFILETGGIAPIIYLVWFRRDKQPGVTKSLFNNPLPHSHESGTEVAEKAQP